MESDDPVSSALNTPLDESRPFIVGNIPATSPAVTSSLEDPFSPHSTSLDVSAKSTSSTSPGHMECMQLHAADGAPFMEGSYGKCA